MHRDSSSTFPPPIDHTNPNFPEHEHLKCPRCDSSNTKFCYYNNYNLSQPRHFCKNCRRYWTKGGTLRNIPVGGGTRKITKRSSNSAKRDSPASNPSLFTESPVSVPMCTDSPVSATLQTSLTTDSPVISPPQRLRTNESPSIAPRQPSPVTAALQPSLTTDSPVISPPQRLLTTESPLISPPQRLLTTKSPPPQTTLTTESPVTAPPQPWQTTTPSFPPPPQPESELETEKETETGPSVVCRLGNDHQMESSGGGGGGFYSMKGFGDLLMVGSNFNLLRKSDEDVLIRNPNAGDFGANFLRLNDVKNQTSGSERGESSCWNGGDNGWPDLSIITPGSTFH